MSDNEITSFIDRFKVFDRNIDTMIAKKDLSKLPKSREFFDSHCVSRTYYFQVKKCPDSQCKFHRPKQLLQKIERFPTPYPIRIRMVLNVSKRVEMTTKWFNF